MKVRMALVTIAVLIISAGAQQESKATLRIEAGRYQIVAQPGTNEVLGNVFLVDTATGKVWRQIDLQSAGGDDNGLEGAPRLWMPMTRIDSFKELVSFSARHPEKTEAK
jgi:hypothetical protein